MPQLLNKDLLAPIPLPEYFASSHIVVDLVCHLQCLSQDPAHHVVPSLLGHQSGVLLWVQELVYSLIGNQGVEGSCPPGHWDVGIQRCSGLSFSYGQIFCSKSSIHIPVFSQAQLGSLPDVELGFP